MAIVQRYVNRNSTAGGDGTTNNTTGATRAYLTITEWEAAEQTDLVTDGDNHIVDCTGNHSQDDTRFIVDGWTTGASNDIVMDGLDPDAGYSIVDGSWSPVRLWEEYITFKRFYVEYTDVTRADTGALDLQDAPSTASSSYNVEQCQLVGSGGTAASGTSAINGVQGGHQHYINNMIHGYWGRAIYPGYNTAAVDSIIYNNTVDGTNITANIISNSGGGSATRRTFNNLTQNESGTGFTDSGTSGGNISEDASSPNTASTTVALVSTTDLHLANGTTAANNAGVDLDADAHPVTVDYDGDSRHATTPDVGADEFATADITIDVPVGSLALAGQVPTATATANQAIDVPVASLSLAGRIPTVTAAANQTIDVPTASLSLAGQIPVTSVSDNQTISVPVASLGLTGQAPTITITENQSIEIPVGSLGITGFAPTAAATANQSIDVPVGALSLTGQVPTADTSSGQTISVPAASLGLTGQAPTVTTTANISIDIPVGSLALAGQVPTADATANISIDIPTASLSLTGQVPIISADGNIAIDVPVGSLSLVGYGPSAVTPQTIDVPTASLGLTGQAPTVQNGVSVTIPVGSLSLSGEIPTITATANISVSVPRGTLSLTGYAPTITAFGGVPTRPGLEYTLPVNMLHFTIDENRLHFTEPDNKLHYAMPEED